jgi:hypothetical protein
VPTNLAGWLGQYLKHRIGRRHTFLSYPSGQDDGIYPLVDESGNQDAEIRVSMAGDWGTGTDEANAVATLMMESNPHVTIHLGDVYYVGDPDELRQNCLDQVITPGVTPTEWPRGSTGSFALNGNHEMYALGNAYFDLFLPTLGMQQNGVFIGQKASFFALRNDYWTIIGLDTGYNSVGIPILENIPGIQPDASLRDELVSWLRDQLQLGNDSRGIILLCHHEYYSMFDDWFPKQAQQLAEFVKRPVLWFWGHEHRLAIYHCQSVKNGIQAYGRCIGHGGMPVDINSAVKHPDCPTELVDNRLYPNTEGITVGFNGYVRLTFLKNTLTVEYLTLRQVGNPPSEDLVASEKWVTVDGTIERVEANRGILDPAIQTSLPPG